MPREVVFASEVAVSPALDGLSGGVPITMSEDSTGTPTKCSERSNLSCASSASFASVSTAKSPRMRSLLTRIHKDRDPKMYYDVVQVLGKGSMGEVSKVCKKQSMIGGSAYYNLMDLESRRNKKETTCFESPLLSGIFGWCLEREREDDSDCMTKSAFTTSTASISSASLWSSSISEGLSYSDRTHHPTESSETSVKLAMKSIHLKYARNQDMIDELENEVAILQSLDHPNIVRVLETFEYNHKLSVVMELCSGADLYTRDPYTEEEAARICNMILSAVSYMHDHGVIHRDLKFENILFVSDAPQADIKLIDFGLSKQFVEHGHMTESTGTIYTMAPEVIAGKYTKQADLWSIGVISYMLLSSQMPFYGKTRQAVVKKIQEGSMYPFMGRRWKKISDQGKEFVNELLVRNPDDRPTAKDALHSPWLDRHRSVEAVGRGPRSAELEAVKQSIIRYIGFPVLRKVALMVLAHQTPSEEIRILRKCFEHYDMNKEGTLNYDEFKAAMQNATYQEEDYRELFDAVDIDGTGKIRYTEFLAAAMDAAGWISHERLAEAFDRVDHNDTGFISKENLRHLLGSEYPEDVLDAIMEEAGSKNGKGISFDDFMTQWQGDKASFESEMRELIGDLGDNVTEGPEEFPVVFDLGILDGESENIEPEARANFVQSKAVSVRKKHEMWDDAGFI